MVTSIRIRILLAAALVLIACAGPAAAMDTEEIALLTEGLPPELRLEVYAMTYLLTEPEVRDLLAYKSEDRVRIRLDEWWRDRDPIYTTDDNEAHEEFAARVVSARTNFRISKWPGWDQRGEVLIRFGAPAWREPIAADVTNVGYKRPGEVWYYREHSMVVVFEDANGSGAYTYYLEHTHLPTGMRPKSDRRTIASALLPGSTMERETLDAAFNAMLNDGSTQVRDPSVEFLIDDFQEMLFKFPEMLESNPAVFTGETESSRIPLDYAVACFRGGDGVDRVDVNAQFVVGEGAAPGGGRKYVTTAVFHDTNGEEVQRNVSTTVLDAGADQPALVLAQLRFTLPPEFYHMALTVEEFGADRFTSLLHDVTCESFDDHLSVSDVVFASRIGPATGQSVFDRGSLQVVPHPRARYGAARAIPIYFEVYNLTPGRDGLAAYTVSYRLTALTPRPAGFLGFSSDTTPLDVASRFAVSASGTTDVVNITLQSGNLWKGDYALEITITDDVTHAAVSRAVEFAIDG